jgi:type I restriction enzyme S subunit
MEFKTEALEFLDIRLIDGDRGKNYPKSHDLSSDGDCLFLSAKNVTRNGFAFSEKMFITKEKDAQLRAGKVQNGDIVVTTRGTVGNIAFYDETVPFPGVRINSGMMIFRADLKRWNRKFLYFLMTSEYIKQQIDSLTSGSAVPQLPAKDLKKFQLPCIPINTQNAISEQIGTITDKINLNNRTNQTLEQMAQALFKSWFVDFDPVFDNLLASVDFKLENLENRLPDELIQKAQRRLVALNSLENAAEIKTSLSALAHELQALSPTIEATQAAVQVSEKAAGTSVKPNFNANPKILAQHANTHAHFPNEFEHNEQLGWIPKGWKSGAFKDVADGLSGYAFKGKDFSEFGCAVLKIKNISTDRTVTISDVNRVLPEVVDNLHRFLLNDGDIIMAMTGAGSVGRFGVVATENNEPYYLNQRVCKLFPKLKNGAPFLFSALNQPGLEEVIFKAAQGSGQPNISVNGILATTHLIPSLSTVELFNRLLKDTYERKITLRKECYKLVKLRDTLLPKLISGELQIPDVATDEEIADL